MAFAEDLQGLVVLLPAARRVRADVDQRTRLRRGEDRHGVLVSPAAPNMDVLELAEEEAGEVEMVHGILEEPVAHVEPVRERPHRPRERAHRQRAELGLRRDLPREAVGAREPLHVSDDDGYARFRGFRREVGGLGRVVCRRLVGEHGDPLADARPDHARELVGV